jgi:hypothetical protein
MRHETAADAAIQEIAGDIGRQFPENFTSSGPFSSLRAQRSNPFLLCVATWIASLRPQ